MTDKPKRTRAYRGAILDSTYWDHYKPRPDDIIISTSMKAGTTWMQRICAALVLRSPDLEKPIDEYSPWVDMRSAFPQMTMPLLATQTHQRFIKSHIPLDALPYYDQVKYIVVCRDGRDVLLSCYHHYRNMRTELIETINCHNGEDLIATRKRLKMETPPEMEAIIRHMQPWEGEDMPSWEDPDIHDYISTWLTKGMYAGENDGYPFWSHFRHLQTWWDYRDMPNILFVHFADLLVDLDGGMRRVADFLDIDIDEDMWPSLVEAATFKTMKSQADKTTPASSFGVWRDNSKFFHKGTNGNWQEIA